VKAPSFWWTPRATAPALCLSPIASVWGALAARRLRKPGEAVGLPVVCVGNFTVGGAGKTPVALAVAALAEAGGHRPFFLSRGYGGSVRGPVRVDPLHHGAGEVGDEPLLLARGFPVVVSRDRPAGARLCRDAGATLVVMDDGLQNPSLMKDLRLVVVDGAVGVGNGFCLPAGPLRAPMAAQWPLVDALVVVGSGAPGEALATDARRRGKPVLAVTIAPDEADLASLRGRPLLAFAGIGRPAKFFDTLTAAGSEVRRAEAFADHHPYTSAEVESLLRQAESAGLTLVTTEKDAVRLAALDASLAAHIRVLRIRAFFAEPDAAAALLPGAGQALSRGA
jgi:tetraacyldisaccharide 4'-kinase